MKTNSTPQNISKFKHVKLVVAVLNTSTVHTDFAMCLANMLYFNAIKGLATGIADIRTSSGPMKGRYDAVKRAQEMEATHILFIDSDQTFPMDAAVRLVERDQPIIGCVIPQRIHPFALNARVNKMRIRISSSDKGVRKVDSIGTGVMLINMAVFAKLNAPYFVTKYEDKDQWTYEDESFCLAAGMAGYMVYADIDLSRNIGHLGDIAITLEHSEAMSKQSA